MFTTYQPKKFNLAGLRGISDQTLEMHFKLYEGYVKETNRLQQNIAGILKDGRVDEQEMPAYSELKRRLGFEYNGMVLHEYYFANLDKDGGGDAAPTSRFTQAVKADFGEYEIWKTDFVGVGKMRGVGWAICYQDPTTGRLSNHWITLHEGGNVAGYSPILVMDVWEHAFILDYKPAERAKYIEAFFANVNWRAVEARLQKTDVRARS
jgi:Fe-Mn family superoxide dismutase